MMSYLRQCVRVVTAYMLVTVFAVPPSALAQAAHVVSPGELHNALASSTQARQHDREAVKQFLSSPKAEKALRAAHMDPVQIKNAVSSLSDQELAQLASRADKAQADFAAGNLTNRDLLIILVAVAALILIIVAVRH